MQSILCKVLCLIVGIAVTGAAEDVLQEVFMQLWRLRRS
jgi:DNA-directed RNA polymerase specialized sigma24 family protein